MKIGAHIIPLVPFTLIALAQCNRADNAERRAQGYQEIVERQNVALKNSSDALKTSSEAIAQLMKATDDLMTVKENTP